ncbi:MAG: hypothetical protein K8I82_23270, partial [Anaerolineae bacterium]|nr:hypothetical protein [Anaerolineae bacterium]
VYDDLWNEEQRAEAERAAYRAKQSQIEDIKKKLSSAELDAIRATMTDVEQQFDIGDVFLNKKIEEKYLHQQDESPTDAVESSKAEPQAVLTEERSAAAHPIPEPATQTKPSEGEILCPYCETYIVPQEIGGQFYCPNDGRVLDRSAQTKPSEGEILCPYCETYIVPQEIGGQFYCPNDGRVLDVSVGTAALKNTPEQIVTVYCDDCGRKVVNGGNASIPEQCPYCNSRNLTHTGNTTS